MLVGRLTTGRLTTSHVVSRLTTSRLAPIRPLGTASRPVSAVTSIPRTLVLNSDYQPLSTTTFARSLAVWCKVLNPGRASYAMRCCHLLHALTCPLLVPLREKLVEAQKAHIVQMSDHVMKSELLRVECPSVIVLTAFVRRTIRVAARIQPNRTNILKRCASTLCLLHKNPGGSDDRPNGQFSIVTGTIGHVSIAAALRLRWII